MSSRMSRVMKNEWSGVSGVDRSGVEWSGEEWRSGMGCKMSRMM